MVSLPSATTTTFTMVKIWSVGTLARFYISLLISFSPCVLVGIVAVSFVVDVMFSVCSWGDELGSSCVELGSSCVIGRSSCVESIVDCDEPPFGCVESIVAVGSIGLSLAGSSSPQRVG